MMSDREYLDAIRFIDKIYKQLYKSKEVSFRKNVYLKFENIRHYLDKMELIHKKALSNPKYIEVIKNLYYEKYIIKRSDIPHQYYHNYVNRLKDQGYGYITLTNELESQIQDEIIKNQKESLDVWLNFLFSEDSQHYSMWSKFWAFQGMLKIGKYNFETKSFSKRRKDNISRFADLNENALKLSLEYIERYIKKKEIDDDGLKRIIKSGSFECVYGYIIELLNSKVNEGVWVKYPKNSDPIPLVKSLRGYNIDWCTLGTKSASDHIKLGDFHIFYTKDLEGKYKVPRVAIRMVDNEIAEIRGIGEGQSVEPELEKIVEAKLNEFANKDIYYKKVKDMEYLTHIYMLYQEGKKLSAYNLRFLYEIDCTIDGFGYDKDPRIKEIIDSRNIRQDLATIFNCSINKIAMDEEELYSNPKEIICNYGNLKYREGMQFPKLKCIIGKADFSKLDTIQNIVPELESVTDTFYGDKLKVAFGLEKLSYIGGSAVFDELKSAVGLNNLKLIGWTAYFNKLTDLLGLDNLISIRYSAEFSSLTSLEHLEVLKYIGGNLHVESLEDTSKLTDLSIGGTIYSKKQKER